MAGRTYRTGTAVVALAAAAVLGAPGTGHAAPGEPRVYSAVYEGRHLLVLNDRGTGDARLCHNVFIDGHRLPVHRIDGQYLSTINSYELFPTLRATGEAAIRNLSGADPLPIGC
ncbi:tyrosinase family oxidase copper chaperone [Longispora albida]|uniref:tyrosinase family oxidase copper chaperone n=1 Tax=Longispora albida TaxID=203523 RepID=UPI0003759714|nr:tyrosinase family oxidase copper chaperone [Longispora albida]